jgi:hypothetical protein
VREWLYILLLIKPTDLSKSKNCLEERKMKIEFKKVSAKASFQNGYILIKDQQSFFRRLSKKLNCSMALARKLALKSKII